MSEPQEPRGCGGTLRLVTVDLAADELPWYATSGQRGHARCEHPDGTAFDYVGVPTPGEQLAHEMPHLCLPDSRGRLRDGTGRFVTGAPAPQGLDGEELCTCLCTTCAEYAGCAACPDCASGCTACGYPHDDNYEGTQR